MSPKFGQIRPLVSIDRVIMAKKAVLYQILFILADHNDVHENSKEIKIWPDPTTDCRDSCP